MKGLQQIRNLCILFLLSDLNIVISQFQLQEFLIYSSSSCSGSPRRLADSTNVTVNFVSLNFSSNGFWSVTPCFPDSTCSNQSNIIIGPPDEWCRITYPPNGATFFQILRYGDPMQQRRSIHLFSERDFKGEEVTVEEGGAQNIDIAVKSYYFAGANTWTLYQGNEYDGPHRCHNYSAEVGRRGYGFTHADNVLAYQVRSVGYGCIPPSTTIATTTSITTTTTTTIGPSPTLPPSHPPSTSTSIIPSTSPPTTITIPEQTTNFGAKLYDINIVILLSTLFAYLVALLN